MSYSSNGRKPLERASKIGHAAIVKNPAVVELLNSCSIPRPPDESDRKRAEAQIPSDPETRIRAVIAIDGGYQEVSVRRQTPSATLTFFTFGPLLLRIDDLEELDASEFVSPEDIARLKQIQRYSIALPTKNISKTGRSLSDSFRLTLHEFFSHAHGEEESLYESLRWLMLRGWQSKINFEWTLPSCPNPDCEQTDVVFSVGTPYEFGCDTCGRPIYFIDAFRFHERISDEQGASAVSGFVMTTLEQIALVRLIRAVWELKPSMLNELLFVKDGPLAFFGTSAPMSQPMRELASFLSEDAPNHGAPAGRSLLSAAGIEKSGAFVEHAAEVSRSLKPGTALLLDDEYIYRFVVPGDHTSGSRYGSNTYWGRKLIYVAPDKNTYVVSVPVRDPAAAVTEGNFQNLSEVLSTVARLKCSMHENALLPVALANRLVSLSDFPSSKILETFARDRVNA